MNHADGSVICHAHDAPKPVSGLGLAAGTIIQVDRSIRPPYPDWMMSIAHPELENSGPAEYDIDLIEQWIHDDQRNGRWMLGSSLYRHLKDGGLLTTCVGLSDLEAIRNKGPSLFRKYFGGKTVCGWRSVGQCFKGLFFVPVIYDGGTSVILNWQWIKGNYDDRSPAARFSIGLLGSDD